MPVNILMPALSPTMEKGKLAKWLKKEGDTVKSGDILAEIETDKATMEVEAVDEGTLGKILVAAGTDDVLVNTPIAMILGEGETAGDIKAPVMRPVRRLRRNRPPQAEADTAAASICRRARGGGANAPEARAVFSPRRWPSASPRRRASTSRLSQGSGPHGRIVLKDVEIGQARCCTGSCRDASAGCLAARHVRRCRAQALRRRLLRPRAA